MLDNTSDLLRRSKEMQHAFPAPAQQPQWLPQMNIQLNAPQAPADVQRPANQMPIEANIRDMLRKLRQQPTPADKKPPQEPPPEQERSVLVPR